MQKTLLSVLPAISILLTIALPTHAQRSRYYDESRITLNAGAGFTLPVDESKGRLDTGWHVTVGGGYYFNGTVGLTGEYSYHSLDVNNDSLVLLNVPSGDANLISLTGNLSGRFGTRSPVGGYIIGGGGAYRRHIEFDQPSAGATITDKWFGDNIPTTVAPGTVLGSFTTWAAGVNFGAGITFGLGGETRLFVEWRYHHVFTPVRKTQYMPITVGVRW